MRLFINLVVAAIASLNLAFIFTDSNVLVEDWRSQYINWFAGDDDKQSNKTTVVTTPYNSTKPTTKTRVINEVSPMSWLY